MKTSTVLIAAAAIVGGVILYEQLKPKPTPTSPLVQIGSGVGSFLQGLSGLSARPAPSTQTTAAPSSIGSIDLNQSAFSKRVSGWGDTET